MKLIFLDSILNGPVRVTLTWVLPYNVSIECLCWSHPDYQGISVICIVYPGQYLGNDVLVTFMASPEAQPFI